VPESALGVAVLDENRRVRLAVAGNSNASEDALRVAARDENEYVRWAVARNPSAPKR